jgi:hypothetical protein
MALLDVLGERVGGLEGQTVLESPLALHEESVVVVDTGLIRELRCPAYPGR